MMSEAELIGMAKYFLANCANFGKSMVGADVANSLL